MSRNRSAAEVLDRDFLEIRARVLELAATLDRIDRAADRGRLEDPRLGQCREAIEILLTPGTARAEAVQRLFSDAYDPDWRRQLPASPRGS